jgi:predicted Zn-dependent protease
MSRREKIQAMLAKEPDDVFLNFGLAMELAKEGDVEAAATQFDRVLQLDENYVAAYFHKGNTLIGGGRLDEARVILTKGIRVAQRQGNDHSAEEMGGLLREIGA